jgi:hypothetical protein
LTRAGETEATGSSRGTAREDTPAAPDGSDRRVGELRRPAPAAVRGPAAGVPDLSKLGLLQQFASSGQRRRPDEGETLPSDEVRFQHTSEMRFARLLDFYGVVWEYEPHEFPIEWDESGSPTGWFRPDFYLPAYDIHIEITTSQQRLVTRKNRKLRLLRENFPEIRCKLFYQRDYLALVSKYGLAEGLAEGEQE